jgi:uncharacterized repeat protein (TIGR03803 family)
MGMMKKIILISVTVLVYLGSSAAPQLVGMTYNGGAHSSGTIMKYTGGSYLSSYYSLTGTGQPGNRGNADPYGALIQASNGKMYGMTYQDGTNLSGTLFQYDYPSNTYTVEFNFDTATGFGPLGSLFQAQNGLLYGLTSKGGANGGGTLFSYAIGTNYVTKLVDLPADAQPYGSLIQASNGKLYGMTKYDGTKGSGTIFEFNPDNNLYTVRYNLLAGAQPSGSLLEVGHDTLYGLTYGDGSNSVGSIFCFAADSGTYTVMYNFSSITGSNPCSSLIRASNGILYGTTALGGVFSGGTIFSFDPAAHIYTDVHDFSGIDGRNPLCSMYQASDGMLYGMTGSGGTYSLGNIFQYNIGTSSLSSLVSFNGNNGASPQFGSVNEYMAAPATSIQPHSHTTCPGSNVTFISAASYTYTAHWQVSTNGGSTYTDLGISSDTLSLTATSSMNGYAYRAVFQNNLGSDTSAAAILTVTNVATGSISASICPGSSYTFQGNTYNTPGVYSHTLSAASVTGCDSTVTLHLAINNSTATISTSICAGEQYNVGQYTHSQSGVYIDTLTGASAIGCDSIVTLQLNVYEPASNSLTTSSCGAYKIGTYKHTVSGIYIDTLTAGSVTGCDSVVYLNLTVYPTAQSTISTTACGSYQFGNRQYTASGTYTETIPGASVNGCDSSVTLNLTINPSAQGAIRASICQNESYAFGNNTYSISGTYTDTIYGGNQYGCDSITNLTLTVNPLTIDSITAIGCQLDGYTVGTHTYTRSGIYVDTVSNSNGNSCGSLRVLSLSLLSSFDNTVNVTGSTCKANQDGVGYQWVSCTTHQAINGASSQNFTATQDGEYQCVLTLGSCYDTTECVSLMSTGIPVVPTSTISLYPSPTAGTFTIEHNYTGSLDAKIVSILGNTVKEFPISAPKAKYDISEAASGIYQVIISNGKQTLKVLRLVKE